MKKKELYHKINPNSLGDALAATPTLRKISKSYDQKINVVTHVPELFKNNPYVKNIYSFEQFNNQLYGVNAVNGGLTDGINSSLIDFQSFEQCYSYYYVDVSRMLPVEESVPKSVQLVGQNQSVQPIDLICFIEYGVSVNIDALTGARV